MVPPSSSAFSEWWLLRVGVGKAVRVVRARAHVNLRCLAHQMVVVDAFRALAGSDVSQDLGEAAVHAGVNERGA